MLYVSDITLYSIRAGVLSQCSVLRTGVMWWCFGVFSNSIGNSILNSLEAVYLGDVYVQEERIAVCELCVQLCRGVNPGGWGSRSLQILG